MSVGIFYRDLLQPGGIPRETVQLAREMVKLVDGLILYCYVAEPSQEGKTEVEGAPVQAFYQPGWRRNKDPLALPGGMKDALLRNDDKISVLVLMGSFIPENVPVARAARAAGISYVVSVGAAFNPFLFTGLKGLKKRLYESAFERRMMDGAARIRLYSEAQVSHLTSRGYSDDGRFFFAKEGIDWDEIEEEDRAASASAFRETPHPITFGFLGRLSTYTKGLDILLQAWSTYKQGGGGGRLIIAGPADRRNSLRLKRIRRRLDLPAMDLLPAIHGRTKYEFLRSLSFLVYPSRHEGIPRVPREALAMGCPIVVTENTNLHDVVEKHQAGAVIQTDSQDLARTFAALENSQREWPVLREGAQRAARELDWADVARDVVEALTSR